MIEDLEGIHIRAISILEILIGIPVDIDILIYAVLPFQEELGRDGHTDEVDTLIGAELENILHAHAPQAVEDALVAIKEFGATPERLSQKLCK